MWLLCPAYSTTSTVFFKSFWLVLSVHVRIAHLTPACQHLPPRSPSAAWFCLACRLSAFIDKPQIKLYYRNWHGIDRGDNHPTCLFVTTHRITVDKIIKLWMAQNILSIDARVREYHNTIANVNTYFIYLTKCNFSLSSTVYRIILISSLNS